jgi:hypothetical protein
MHSFLSLLEFDPSAIVCAVAAGAFAVRWFAVPADQLRNERMLLLALGCFLFAVAGMVGVRAISYITPAKFDLYVYKIDGFFGEPSFVLGRLIAGRPAVFGSMAVIYGLLPAVVMAILLLYAWWIPEGLGYAVRSFLLNVLLALAIYVAFPVCGPFPSFPGSPGHVAAHAIALNAPPNGVPSVHMSAAFLIWWFGRRWKAVGVFGAIYVLLTLFTILASGEHYLFDAIVAIPFTALVLVAAEEPWLNSAELGERRDDETVDGDWRFSVSK